MKYVILSDVHANLEALTAVIKAVHAESPDVVWFLGDAVGYGPDPNECLALLQKLSQVMLLGNHDAAAAGLMDDVNFNIYAREALTFTAKALLEESAQSLHRLPYRIDAQGACLAHASPLEPEKWHYLLSYRGASRHFDSFHERLCFIGHSHYPFVFRREQNGAVDAAALTEFNLDNESRYIVNVGSVGQPRDGDPRAAYVVYDDAAALVSLKRVPYDINAVQEKMVKAGLPEFLIKRLSRGR